MMPKLQPGLIDCPYCATPEYSTWAQEAGFTAVRCKNCALIYVNPRPAFESIEAAVRTGLNGSEAQQVNVASRRINAKVTRYRGIFAVLLNDVWREGKPVSWLDVGAGYGEVVEAITALAPMGSKVEGLEPMKPKAEQAIARGLAITQDYLRPTHSKVGFVSVIDVFSHIPEFDKFLLDVKSVLEPGGELLIETGNLADLSNRDEFPGELGLPDHLVFAGERQLCGYITNAGFEIIHVEKIRIDGMVNLIKNIVKKVLGRPVKLALPYTSNYRQLFVRARLLDKFTPDNNSPV